MVLRALKICHVFCLQRLWSLKSMEVSTRYVARLCVASAAQAGLEKAGLEVATKRPLAPSAVDLYRTFVVTSNPCTNFSEA